METIKGYKLLEEKRASTCGQICKAEKNRKTYLLKFFHNPVEPNPAVMDEKTFAINRAAFEDHKRRRTLLNQKLRKNTADGGNIVVPVEEFVSNSHWVEVTPFLSDTVAPDRVLATFSGLDRDGQFMCMKSVAGGYRILHGCGVVHGDGKLTNMLLRRNSAGNYVFSLIDFDGAFSVDDVPEDKIVATQDYFSPEMGIFSVTEVDKRDKTMITPKHDIFCMGLIFHQLLTGGKMPIPDRLPPHLQKRRDKGKPIYLYTAMLASTPDCPYRAQIDPAIEPNLAALIGKMLDLDPDNRPTSEQVLRALNRMSSTEEMELPETDFHWNREKLLSDGFTEAEKTERYGREGYLLTGFAKSRFMVPHRLFELGYATEKVEDLKESIVTEGDDKPWPEHKILFLPENIRRRGFEVTRGTRKGLRGYQVVGSDGSVRFMPSETLQLLGLARRA